MFVGSRSGGLAKCVWICNNHIIAHVDVRVCVKSQKTAARKLHTRSKTQAKKIESSCKEHVSEHMRIVTGKGYLINVVTSVLIRAVSDMPYVTQGK